jgi:hypothetical protein
MFISGQPGPGMKIENEICLNERKAGGCEMCKKSLEKEEVSGSA